MLKQKSDVINLGCRLNSYESEVIIDILEKKNINNVTVINTCAVTNQAVRKSELAIKKAKKEKPNNKIYVTGCASQIEKKKFANNPSVDRIIDNRFKNEENFYLKSFTNIKEEKKKFKFSNPLKKFKNRTRALLQIQQGCNHRCTFCIIPFGRGSSVSLPFGEIVRRTKKLLASGYKEIIFTGIDLTSYGADLPGKPTLGSILKRLLKLAPELERIRFSSIDPAEIDIDLLEIFSFEKRILPHIHFSAQSGDNLLLKRMKRRHNREKLIDLCNIIKKNRPEMTFGADLIIGFPTENELYFKNTIQFVSKCKFTNLHIFPFSPKIGTPASRMPQVKNLEKVKRVSLLRKIGQKIKTEKMKEKVGTKISVLFESEKLSYTDDYFKLKIISPGCDKLRKGDFVEVKILGIKNDFLIGKINGL